MKRAFGAFVLLLGCSNTSAVPEQSGNSEPVGVSRQAVGEQQNGYPTPWERATFMAANRARSDPATVKGTASTIYPAVKPLVLEYPLEQSSRFHATNLQLSDVTLMHTSPCTLKTDVADSGCSGDPMCACMALPIPVECASCAKAAAENDCGTDPFTRIRYFYKPANAEVAAAGYQDPWSLMDAWVDEAAGADGHRTIIDSVGHTTAPNDQGVAGFGHASGTGDCYGTFDVGDFGPTTTAPPMIASAAPKPISSKAAGAFTLYATWYDPAGGAPADLNAVVDGTCTPMTLELGTATLNATYMAAVSLAVGCHSVFIVGDNAGRTVRTTYPTTTAFTIPVGSGACADEVTQPVAQCAGVDGGVGGADASLDSSSGGSKDSGGGIDGGVADGAKGGTDGSPTGRADGAAGDSAGGDASEGNEGGSSTGGEAGSDAALAGTGDDASGLSTGGEGGGVVAGEGGIVASDEGGAGGLDATFLGGGLDASMPGFGLIEAGDDAAGPASTKSGCACGVAPTRTSGAWSALAAAGLVFPLRRRRWRRIIASRAS